MNAGDGICSIRRIVDEDGTEGFYQCGRVVRLWDHERDPMPRPWPPVAACHDCNDKFLAKFVAYNEALLRRRNGE